MRKLLKFVIAGIVLLSIAWILLRNHRLRATQKFIEKKYAKQIQLLESEMLRLDREVDFQGIDSITSSLKKHFQLPEIFYAVWSDDGHHHLCSIIPLTTQIAMYPNLVPYLKTTSGHEVFFGSAKTGNDLIYYRGKIRQAERMRQYDIVFDAKLLHEIMNQE
jgi:hypothetical protein